MAEYADEIRIPISMQVRMPRTYKSGMPHRGRVVNHPANGWSEPKPEQFPDAVVSFAANRRPEAANQFSIAPSSNGKSHLIADLDGPGVPVILPNGSMIPDDKSPTGKLMAPTNDLRPVALAGKKIGSRYKAELESRDAATGAFLDLSISLGLALGHAGRFDYQREGNIFQGYVQHRQFRNVSNFNIGLLCQQAGLSLDDTLWFTGTFARARSSNYRSDEPYGVDPQDRIFIERGFEAGESGAFENGAKL